MDAKALVKKQGVGTWLSLGVAVLGIVSFVIYLVNGASAGYFKGTENGSVIAMTVLAIVFAIGAVILAQFNFEGVVQKVLKVVNDVLMVAAAALLIASLLMFVGDRIEGLAYIFGSDANTLSEIQTPDNMSSASTAITGFILYGITWLCAMAAAFFKLTKKA